ncbi:glycoside hydrolase [Piromyces finnis]|uniref:Beta-xylanase n=1 Tax=Piromyces finnis TaxID=1754191 RepID=A0A1Y1V0I3_9FUNG|nr:glycoside hydrolase [Piromyces finnis]ORX44856.1 glycoside hydrolase [Piromyces finnis]|eukprot:ORX44627.1 glycoside hydrolase [Piromyces finnis]
MKFNSILLLSSLSAVALARPHDNACWSEKFNIPCCQTTKEVVRTTYDGIWGMENGEWCGLGTESTRPKDDIPPSPPALLDLDSVVDPAADCDISNVITGDSLAQEAPFRFGVGFNGAAVSTSTTSSKVMRELVKYQFNSFSYSNLMKPLFVLDQAGCQKNFKNGSNEIALNFTPFVDGLDYAQKNGLHIRGHVLVWHKQFPDWFFREEFDDAKEYVSEEVIYERLENYIKQYLGFVNYNYPGVVDVWDVVNEAVEVLEGKFDNSTGWYTRTITYEGDRNIWYDFVGPDYVVKTFRIARKYALPNVKLVYNDYDTFAQQPHDKTQAIIDLMHILQKEDLVDALGMQSYIQPIDPPFEENVANYDKALQRFAAEGFEIQITEFTIYATNGEDWLETQVYQYRKMMETIMKNYKNGANITSVTVFGLQDGYRFYESDSTKTRLFDHELQKKPTYEAIMEVLKAYNAEVNDESNIESDEEISVDADVDVAEDSADDDSDEE